MNFDINLLYRIAIGYVNAIMKRTHNIPFIIDDKLSWNTHIKYPQRLIKGICKQNIGKEFLPSSEKNFPNTLFSIRHEKPRHSKLPNNAVGNNRNKEFPYCLTDKLTSYPQ